MGKDAEEVDHLPGVTLAGDEEDVPDAGALQQLQRVVDHRPTSDRQQVFVGDAGQLAEASGLPARADEALGLHAGRMLLLSRSPPVGSQSRLPSPYRGHRTYRRVPEIEQRGDQPGGEREDAPRPAQEKQHSLHRGDASRHT